MSYTLEHSIVQGCLLIRIHGTWPSKNAANTMADIFTTWEQYKKPLALDIRNMEDTPSVFGDYDEARQFADAGFYLVGRIAVIDTPKRREANDFFETTSYNCGLRFRFFYSDEKEAIAWLTAPNEEQI